MIKQLKKFLLPTVLCFCFSSNVSGQVKTLSMVIDSIMVHELKFTPEINKEYISNQIIGGTENTTSKLIIRDYQDPNPEPLIIIDRFVIEKVKLDNFRLDEIKSIKTLADTTAVQLYGSRARNGVVLIESKLPKRKLKKKL